MAILYVFIDESGNFDFLKSGTKHLVLCAYSTTEPQQHTLALQKLKYTFLSLGHDLEYFHATEDKQQVRDKVFEIIKRSRNAIFDMVYLQKNKVHPAKQNKRDIYGLLVNALLAYIFERLDEQNYEYEQIIVIMDKAFTNNEQRYLKQIIKLRLKNTGRPFRLYFFQNKADPNRQVADYGAWGKYVSLERNELRPIKEIESLIVNNVDVFHYGTNHYY